MHARQRFRPPERLREARVVDRLEQIVDGVYVEGMQGVVRVGGDEDNGGGAIDAHLLEQIEAIDFGHLDV